MKRLLTLVAFFATLHASAQQVNPVPDYVFRNQMSVGRNAVTDTAAYFSIGPRYGATKGFMPPIVGDTATFSSGKRNGLLIFSVQKNKFLYWDSVRVQWSDMAGSSGAYIVAGDTASMLAPYLRKSDTTAMLSPYYRSATASAALALKLNISDTATMLSPYYRSATATAALATKLNISDTSTMLSPYARTATVNASLATKLNISDTSSMLGNYIRHAGYGLTKSGQSFLVDTLNISTRAWRQKGLDSLAALEVSGSGTTNYVPKFTGSTTLGNSSIIDNALNVNIQKSSGVNDVGLIVQQTADFTASFISITANNDGGAIYNFIRSNTNGGTNHWQIGGGGSVGTMALSTNGSERLRIFANGRIGVNTTTDAGYQFDVNGTLRSVNDAYFATTSGNVGVGTAAPNYKFNILSGGGSANIFAASQTGVSNGYTIISDGTNLTHTWYNAGTESLQLKAGSELLINTTSDAGDYKLQVAGNAYVTGDLTLTGTGSIFTRNTANTSGFDIGLLGGTSDANAYVYQRANAAMIFATNNTERGRINSAGEWIIDASGTDAGDYKLQVVGNARIGTGKLDIASNTTFGLGIARSGTSEVAGQIYNSNGILYLGAESSAGGQIFSGSSAYAAVIGSGANYPLQFAVNNTIRGGFNTGGELLINTTSDTGDYKLQVGGNIYASGSIVTGSSITPSALYVAGMTTGNGAVYHTGSRLTLANYNTNGTLEFEVNGGTYAMRIDSAGNVGINQTVPTEKLHVGGNIMTAAPSGGTAKPFKIGEAATVSPTSPNRTIRVEIDGTVYYLHAKTTND